MAAGKLVQDLGKVEWTSAKMGWSAGIQNMGILPWPIGSMYWGILMGSMDPMVLNLLHMIYMVCIYIYIYIYFNILLYTMYGIYVVLMLTWLGYIDGIHGTPYIAAPWILWVKTYRHEEMMQFTKLWLTEQMGIYPKQIMMFMGYSWGYRVNNRTIIYHQQ